MINVINMINPLNLNNVESKDHLIEVSTIHVPCHQTISFLVKMANIVNVIWDVNQIRSIKQTNEMFSSNPLVLYDFSLHNKFLLISNSMIIQLWITANKHKYIPGLNTLIHCFMDFTDVTELAPASIKKSLIYGKDINSPIQFVHYSPVD